MRISVLDSGSKGNSTVIELNNYSFLIDVGISFKSLLNRLLLCNVELNIINSIFITHEHVDHIGWLKKQNNEEYCDNKHNLYSKLNNQLTNLYMVRLEHVLMWENLKI